MTTAEFTVRFPRLFHMAEASAWPLIQEHGLLSTQALLDLFEVQGQARDLIERRQRPGFTAIEHPQHGKALIRDQHPMSDATLAPALQDELLPADWYAILNARVFFFVEEEKLLKLQNTYRQRQNIVLVLDSARVLADCESKITLSPINSGFSLRYAQPRGLSTFKRLKDFDTWKVAPSGKRSRASIAEFAVDYSLPDVEKYLLEKRG